MSAVERRTGHGFFPDLLDWLESPVGVLRPGTATHAIRVEDYMDDQKYVIRAELPGVDPNKDIEITISGGVLKIQAERQETHKTANRSEFRYGTFVRTVPLPSGAVTKDVTARYADGVLEVTVPVPEAKDDSRRVTVDTTR